MTSTSAIRSVRPRRSVLYVPGSNAKTMEKARSLAADGLILDLEDAVIPEAKTDARQAILDALAERRYGAREVLVRINGLDTRWGTDDIRALAKSGADGILIPKVRDAGEVRLAHDLLMQAGAPESLAIWCMMEAPMGILRAEDIARASSRMAGFVMGTSDMLKDLHARHTASRQPVMGILSYCLLVARAYGLAILDGVHVDLSDMDGFEQACIQGRDMGFDGKTVFHPKTIDTANRIFGPSNQDIDWSRRVMAASAQAAAKGQGAVTLDGKLVEKLDVDIARRVVGLADRIAELETELGKILPQ